VLALKAIAAGRRDSARLKRLSSRDGRGRGGPVRSPRARALLLACSAFVDWGLFVGIEPSLSSLFNEAVIEHHVATAMAGDPASSRRTRRANLRFVARALEMPSGQSRPDRRGGPAAPYSPSEVEAYFALARCQITARRRAMEAMLCLGLGAGLDGLDMRYVTGRHVVSRSGGLVVIVEGTGASRAGAHRYQDTLGCVLVLR